MRRGRRRVLAAGLALAGLFAAAPALCDPPVPPQCLAAAGSSGIGGRVGPINQCVLYNGMWIVGGAVSARTAEPALPFPPPGIVVGAVPRGPVSVHDSLSTEEREGLDRFDIQLAERLGGEARAAALDAILTLRDPNGWHRPGDMLAAFVRSYSLPELTPDIEAVVVARYWQGDFFSHQYSMLLLPEQHRYHSRALFDRIVQELAVTQTWDAIRLTAALFNYDQPEVADAVVAVLDRLPPRAAGEVALTLLGRGDPRALAVTRRAMAVLDGAPQVRDYYLIKLGDAVAGLGTPEAYAVLADLLRQIQHDRPVKDNQLQHWSGVLLRAPRELHIDLRGIEPAPAGAATETLRALARLLQQRPAAEALLTDKTAEHLRQLIALGDVAGVREYVAQRFDVNSAIGGAIGGIMPAPSLEMLQILLQGGADPQIRDAAGNTWLHRVCEARSAAPAEGLPDQMQAAQALAYARDEADRAKEVQALIAAGADVNAGNNVGLTPLMLAVQSNHPQILRLLLQAGARTDAVDRSGRTAMIMAIDDEYHGAAGAAELQQILRQGGAAYELRYRLRSAPRRHPLGCLAIIAAGALALGLARLLFRRGHRPKEPGQSGFSQGEKLYFAGLGSVVHAASAFFLLVGSVPDHWGRAAVAWCTWPVWLVAMIKNKGAATWGFYVPLALSLPFLALAGFIFLVIAMFSGGMA